MSQLSFSFDIPLALLTPDEIFQHLTDERLTTLQEDRRVERKPPGIHGKALGEYFSMWANTVPSGGLIVVGIEDKGGLTGCHKLSQRQINDLEKSSYAYCPDARVDSRRVPVTSSDGAQSFLIVFRVHYREDKVVLDSGGNAYVRVADEKHRLSEAEIRELQIDKGQVDLEQEPVKLNFPDDFDMALVRAFVEGLKGRRELTRDHRDIDLLEHRRLGSIKGGKFVPNVAAALLFARDPLRLFPGCKIRFLRVDGEIELSGDKYNITKDISMEGPIPHLIDEAARVIDSQLRQYSRFGEDGKFSIVPEYPRAAWFEALVNACVHRSYGLKNVNIFVKMFDDKLVVESPGGFPPFVTPENIYASHHPRNPHLMDALFYMDLVKEHGEGTKRMRDTMSGLNLPLPEFRQTMSGSGAASVRVTLRNNRKQRTHWVDSDVALILGDDITRDLSQEEKRTLNYVAEHGSINVTTCHRINPSLPKWHSAKKILERLRSKGLLEHRHSPTVERDSHAHYVLPEAIKRNNGKTNKE
jgi:ATP-dependent DNA helicase RecG